MKATGKRGLAVLAAASALAMVGIVALAVKAVGRAPQWLTAAAASPLAVRCAVLMAGGVLVLGLLVALLVRVRPRLVASRRGLHVDQGGTAAIEMAFVFPLGLMIFLTITQAALLFNANMVVHYAAFAAARMATVVVPMEINDESHNLVYSPDQGISQKREMIRRAAVLALVPISASLETTAAGIGDDFLPGAEDMVVAQTRQVMGLNETGEPPGWLRRVAAQYAYADGMCTRLGGSGASGGGGDSGGSGGSSDGSMPITMIELAPPDHWQDGDPDPDCPYRHTRRPEDWYTMPQWWTAWEPYCPFYHRDLPIWDYWYWEMLDVKLTYQFLLEVPYASRFLGDEITVEGLSGRNFAAQIRVVGSLSNEGGPEPRPAG